MTRHSTGLLALAFLSGCVSLPGSDAPATSRYTLLGPGQACGEGRETLVLSVPRAGVGLDTERIARRNANTGEITYLKDVRWADQAASVMEQRMVQDLECHGFTVLSSHHQRLGQQKLVCEIRALNLVEYDNRDEAEVGLSCLLYRTGDQADLPIVSNHRSPLRDWSANSAVAAMSSAYQSVLADLVAALE